MALSGTFYQNVGSHWRVQVEWTANQSISGNYSDVTAKLYWIGRTQYSATSSSATKSGFITIDGNSSSFSGAGLGSLRAYQKKLLHTHTVRVNHNSDGSMPRVNMAGSFSMKLTLSGKYYGTVTTSDAYALNTIPRASKLSRNPNWTAGNNLALSISRATSKFTHRARVYVKDSSGSWDYITEKTDIGSSATMSFTTAQHTEIFQALKQAGSRDTRVILDTYDGSSHIGNNYYYGTVSAPSASKLTSAFDHYVWVDQTITGDISRSNSSFRHKAVIKVGSYTKTIDNISTSFSWNPSSSEESSIYAQMPNDTNVAGTITLYTYYNGVQVRSGEKELLDWYVPSSERPTISSSVLDYYDSNSSVTSITGNNNYIVQGQSNFIGQLKGTGSPSNGATVDRYVLTISDKEKSVNGTASVDFGKIDESTNQTLTVKIVDSRGLTASASITVTMLAHKEPQFVLDIERENKFETTTRADVGGTFSTVTVGSTKKNNVQSISYRYREKGGSYGSSKSLSYTTSGNAFSASNFSLQLDNTKAWEIEFSVSDKFGTSKQVVVVSEGQPIMFVDADKNSVGINKFPERNKSFEIDGGLHVHSNEFEGITVESDKSGVDPVLYFKTASGSEWSMRMDESINNRLDFRYGNSSKFRFETNGDFFTHGKIDVSDYSYFRDHVQFYNRVKIGDIDMYEDDEDYLRIVPRGYTTTRANVSANQLKLESGVDIKGGSGSLRMDDYRYENGYNMLSVRDGTGSSNDTYLIQNKVITVDLNSNVSNYADMNFPTAFDDEPLWIIGTAINASASNYNVGIYNPAKGGCRVYAKHVEEYAWAGSIEVQVVACGRRASAHT